MGQLDGEFLAVVIARFDAEQLEQADDQGLPVQFFGTVPRVKAGSDGRATLS